MLNDLMNLFTTQSTDILVVLREHVLLSVAAILSQPSLLYRWQSR